MTVRKGLVLGKKDPFQKVDVDKVMEKIRAELRDADGNRGEAQRDLIPHAFQGPKSGSVAKERLKKTFLFRAFIRPILRKIRAVALPRSIYPAAIKCKDLLLHEDEKFVKEAYKTLLHRLPEPEGLDFWLFRIRHLGWKKIKILWLISKSHEGIIHNLHIRGLRSRYFFFKTGKILLGIPLIGWVFKLVLFLFRLPGLGRKVERLERYHKIANTEREHTSVLREHQVSLSGRLDEIERRLVALDKSQHIKSPKKQRLK